MQNSARQHHSCGSEEREFERSGYTCRKGRRTKGKKGVNGGCRETSGRRRVTRRYDEVRITRERGGCRGKVVVRARVGNGNGEDGRGGATGKQRTGRPGRFCWCKPLLWQSHQPEERRAVHWAPGWVLGYLVPLAEHGGQFFFFSVFGGSAGDEKPSRQRESVQLGWLWWCARGVLSRLGGRVQGRLLGAARRAARRAGEGRTPGTRHARCILSPVSGLEALRQATSWRIAQSHLSGPAALSFAVPPAQLCCAVFQQPGCLAAATKDPLNSGPAASNSDSGLLDTQNQKRR